MELEKSKPFCRQNLKPRFGSKSSGATVSLLWNNSA